MRQLDSDVAWRAVWLLKQLARDRKLGEEELIRLATCADELPPWVSRLNLCQLFAITGCPPSAREALYSYLVESFGNQRVIIRAWAISVLIGFQADPIYRNVVAAMLREAQKDPAKSMQARLRHLVRPQRATAN